MYRIVQITDLHIGSEGECPADVDVRGNLVAVLEAVRGENPDLLVVSGDLSYRDGDEDAYRFVRGKLDSFAGRRADAVPYHLIAGNHDLSRNLAAAFGLGADLHAEELYYAIDATKPDGPVVGAGAKAQLPRLLFLDSARGTVSDAQLAWLEREVAELNGSSRSAIVFIHHPPILCNCLFMDTHYPFRRGDDLVPLLASLSGLKAIFCGHYHADAVAALPGRPEVNVHVTPALWFQIDRSASELVISDRRPGYRVIDTDGGSVTSVVRYVQVTPK